MAVCELVEESPGLHRCRTCRRGWRGSPGRRECHGPVEIPEKRSARVISSQVDHGPKPLRVGMLLANWCMGGVERYHEAIYKWTSPRIEWSGLALPDGAPVYDASLKKLSRSMPVYLGDASQLSRGSDIILTWAVADLQNHIGGFKGRVVAISHGDGDWLRSRINQSWRRSTDFVAVSREASHAFPGEVRSRVVIQSAGVEIDRISPSRSRHEIRQEWGVQSDQIAVGYVGRFSPEKNPLHVARIVGKLGGKYVAVYHGHNPWGEPEFKAEAAEISGGRVRFIPPSCHTGDVYAGVDKLVQASSAEGGPLVAIEAWATNTQLVTTDVGVISDDDELRAMSIVVPKNASLDEWCFAVENTTRWETRTIAAERYSAAAAARRWENYLCDLVDYD